MKNNNYEITVGDVLWVIGLLLLFIWMSPVLFLDTTVFCNDKGICNAVDIFDAEMKVRLTVAQLFGGSVIVIGAFATWKRMVALEKSNEIEQDGQVTDRFIKAVELLGKDSEVEVLGGVYSLERIAKDSPHDHSTIMEILAAYIRKKFPTDTLRHEIRHDQTRNVNGSIILQSIIDVFCRRNTENDRGTINLSRSLLSGLVFKDPERAEEHPVDLSNFRFDRSYLGYSIFTNVVVTGRNFRYCDLRDSSFYYCTIKNGDPCFNSSRLYGILISKCILEDVIITDISPLDHTEPGMWNDGVREIGKENFENCEFRGKTEILGVYPPTENNGE